MSRRLVRATALFVIVSLAWFAPPQALAQLSSLIVTITSPANGSTVSGTITVTASVTIIGILTVDSVQFKLDGANLGAADTSAPYSIPWNTTTSGNGSHVLTAVARDHLGIQYTSDPVTVTVSNDTTPPTVTINQAVGQPDPAGTAPVNFTAVFSEPVSGFTGTDVTISGTAGGTKTATVTGGPNTYSVAVSGMTSGGTVTATIGAGVVTDAAGNGNTASTSTDNTVTFVPPDTTPPTVSLTAPANGATVSGSTPVNASASDNVGVVGVQFFVDGNPLGTEDTAAPYSRTWNTTTASNGTHTLTAVARDAAGNSSTSTAVTVTVVNDTTSPAPPSTPDLAAASDTGASNTDNITADTTPTFTGTAEASSMVRIFSDGTQVGSGAATGGAYSITTGTLSSGSHSITATATDGAGNASSPSGALSVTIDPISPAVTINQAVGQADPASAAPINFTAVFSEPVSGFTGTDVTISGTAGGAKTAAVSGGPSTYTVAVSGMTSGGTVTATIGAGVASDAAGNGNTASTSVDNTVQFNPPDTTPPTVSLTAPANGATVSGTITVSANASDNVGVVGVQFKLDGANLSAEDTSAPYAISWDTTTASNGSHTLTAVARDAAGNSTTSAVVTVTVSNGAVSGGDVFLAFANDGRVQWYNPDGSLRQVLVGSSIGQASSVAFDAAGNIYVPHWANQTPGNLVDRFDPNGNYLSTFGSGYNCNPASMTFDSAGNAYVGQTDCTGDILKFNSAGTLVASFDVFTPPRTKGERGTDHIDLAGDGCTMFYTSRDRDIRRYDVCTNTQLSRFNTQDLPGEIGNMAFHLVIMPDGGVLLANGFNGIVRLDAAGNQVQVYSVAGETNFWGGVDYIGDGSTFWATNAWTDKAYKFDLQSEAVLATINVGTSGLTLAGVGVRPSSATPPPPSDTTPPTASLTAPANGATVSGTISVSASASDNVGVVGVQFKLDGANLGAEDLSAPYAVSWATTTASNGSHTLTAVARDAAGNSTTSAVVTVTVSNGAPDTTPPTVSLTAPANGATVSGTITVSANASDNVGVVGVQFKLDGANLGAEDSSAPYAVSWDTTTASNGSHTLTAVARDAASNSTTATMITVTVSNGPPSDTTPPTVSLTAPANGATVSGTITVSANASDNVGVIGVQFKLDGADLSAEDPSAPYAVSWNTTTASNGSHTLTAVARDAAGNSTTSAAVTVTVSNGAVSSGDVFLAFIDGSVQWRNPDGSLRQTLIGVSDGQASSVAFDAAGNAYVPHWWSQTGKPSNIVERWDPNGTYLGTFGSGYNPTPSSMAFDAAGNMYVGHADPPGDILKFDTAGNRVASFDVPTTNRGTDHIDLAGDGCTMFYTSRDVYVYRYNVCTNTPLPPFNTQPLPGDIAYHLRVLPDGGVLVADGTRLVRLDAAGNLAPTVYAAPGETNYWGGVDYIGDGSTFWASNAWTDKAYKFDLQSGTILATINVGTGGLTLAGVGVRP